MLVFYFLAINKVLPRYLLLSAKPIRSLELSKEDENEIDELLKKKKK